MAYFYILLIIALVTALRCGLIAEQYRYYVLASLMAVSVGILAVLQPPFFIEMINGDTALAGWKYYGLLLFGIIFLTYITARITKAVPLTSTPRNLRWWTKFFASSLLVSAAQQLVFSATMYSLLVAAGYSNSESIVCIVVMFTYLHVLYDFRVRTFILPAATSFAFLYLVFTPYPDLWLSIALHWSTNMYSRWWGFWGE